MQMQNQLQACPPAAATTRLGMGPTHRDMVTTQQAATAITHQVRAIDLHQDTATARLVDTAITLGKATARHLGMVITLRDTVTVTILPRGTATAIIRHQGTATTLRQGMAITLQLTANTITAKGSISCLRHRLFQSQICGQLMCANVGRMVLTARIE